MNRGVGAVAVAAVTLVACLSAAEAHESRTVGDGRYELVVGFLDEPAFAGEKNGLSLSVSAYGSAATPKPGGGEPVGVVPVEGLEETLDAEVRFGDQAMDLMLDATWGDPGHYEAVFFPMEPGDYTFRVSGKVEGEEIDESFTSSPTGFSPVQDPGPLRFPRDGDATAMVGFMASSDVTQGPGLVPAMVGVGIGIGGVGLQRIGRRSMLRT